MEQRYSGPRREPTFLPRMPHNVSRWPTWSEVLESSSLLEKWGGGEKEEEKGKSQRGGRGKKGRRGAGKEGKGRRWKGRGEEGREERGGERN